MNKIEFEVEVDDLGSIISSLSGKESGFAKAAFQEYHDMVSGNKIFSRASDIKEYRLLLMIENVFGVMPSETVVADLFQMKRSEARTLMNNVDAKFRRRLADTKKKALLNVIKEIEKKDESDYDLYCDSIYIIESLNNLIPSGSKMIHKDPIEKNHYMINADTLKELESKLE